MRQLEQLRAPRGLDADAIVVGGADEQTRPAGRQPGLGRDGCGAHRVRDGHRARHGLRLRDGRVRVRGSGGDRVQPLERHLLGIAQRLAQRRRRADGTRVSEAAFRWESTIERK